MRKTTAKLRGLAYIFWHSRHMGYHLLIGLAWIWLLREVWNGIHPWWILLSLFGSLFPDAEHMVFFLRKRNHDDYAKMAVSLLRDREWRTLAKFIEKGHKYNTKLAYHNIYSICILGVVLAIALRVNAKSLAVFIGAMIFHYLFDICDDLAILGKLNPNWFRWGNGIKKRRKAVTM